MAADSPFHTSLINCTYQSKLKQISNWSCDYFSALVEFNPRQTQIGNIDSHNCVNNAAKCHGLEFNMDGQQNGIVVLCDHDIPNINIAFI